MATTNNYPTAPQYNTDGENYQEKCLCVLVLDTSGSMNSSGAINDLNNGLATFYNETMKDVVTRDRLELAVITFNSNIEVIQKPDILPNISIPTLSATGQTQLVSAIIEAQEMVERRKDYYKYIGIPYYRPWIVVMTDGDPYPPGQDIDGLAAQIKTDTEANKYVFFIIGVGDEVQDNTLNKLATKDFPAARMDGVKFSEFFTWLSASASIVVKSGDDPNNNPLGDWTKGLLISTDPDIF